MCLPGNTDEARPVARQDRSAATVACLYDWLHHHRAHASAKSPFGEALAWIAKDRECDGRFATDGRIEACEMNVINPHAWLACALTAIVSGRKHDKANDLLPWYCGARV